MTESIEQEIRTLRSIFWSGRDPEGRAFVPLADAYRRAGSFRQAVELLTDGLERHPGFTSGHVVAAQLYHDTGLAEEAEFALRRVLEIDSDNLVALDLLADSLRARGEMQEAKNLRDRHRELAGVESGEAEERVVEMVDLAPEPVVDITDLAPDEPEETAEPVFEMADLAPEPVVEIADLAPDEHPVAADLVGVAADPVEGDAAEVQEIDDQPMITRTMAELFAAQGLMDRALLVFRQLLDVTPGDAGLRQRVAELSARVEGSRSAEAAPEAAPPSLPDGELGSSSPEDDDLSGHAWDADAQAANHDVDTPFAWTHQDPDDVSRPGPPISAYFSSMLAWKPGAPAAPQAREAESESEGGDDPIHGLNREDV
ncbi:MAG TPA: tetratricopeptide repeat protein [Longimicrobiales bacterium]|nr:tetratricopeptide repeat protein [Longimicrobiales bacterium]